jgi:hypothetical protein
MTYKSKLIVASVFLLTLMLESALADSVRCGSHIISTGERHGTDKYEVLKKCGEPTIRAGNTWIYEKPNASKSVMVFDASGKLSRIE